MGVVNHVSDRKGSQFYAFNEQIFMWKAIFVSNIHNVMTLCANLALLGSKGLSDDWCLIHPIRRCNNDDDHGDDDDDNDDDEEEEDEGLILIFSF